MVASVKVIGVSVQEKRGGDEMNIGERRVDVHLAGYTIWDTVMVGYVYTKAAT